MLTQILQQLSTEFARLGEAEQALTRTGKDNQKARAEFLELLLNKVLPADGLFEAYGVLAPDKPVTQILRDWEGYTLTREDLKQGVYVQARGSPAIVFWLHETYPSGYYIMLRKTSTAEPLKVYRGVSYTSKHEDPVLLAVRVLGLGIDTKIWSAGSEVSMSDLLQDAGQTPVNFNMFYAGFGTVTQNVVSKYAQRLPQVQQQTARFAEETRDLAAGVATLKSLLLKA